MSKIFNKNNLRDIFSELNTDYKMNLPEYLNIKNVNSSDNTSSFLPQKGGSFTVTSANKNTDEQVNQLISMLTSESNDKHNFSANSTATDVLENRLRNMLKEDKQDGGAKKKHKKQKGGSNDINNIFLKPGTTTVTSATSSEMPNGKVPAILSDTSVVAGNNSVISATSTNVMPNNVPALLSETSVDNNATSSAMPSNIPIKLSETSVSIKYNSLIPQYESSKHDLGLSDLTVGDVYNKTKGIIDNFVENAKNILDEGIKIVNTGAKIIKKTLQDHVDISGNSKQLGGGKKNKKSSKKSTNKSKKSKKSKKSSKKTSKK